MATGRARMSPADVAPDGAPADARGTAIRAARTATESHVLLIEVLAGFSEEFELINEPFEKRDVTDLFLFQNIG